MAENDMLTGFLAGQADNNNGGGGGMWGSDAIWAIILFALIFNGRNGFGGLGGGTGNGCGCCATQEDVRNAVDQQTLISKLDQQTYGIADTFTALNNTLNGNFRGVDNAICTLGFQNQQGFSGLGAQLASCCCDIERGQDRIGAQIAECCCDLKTQAANNTRDIIDAQNCNTRAILDFLTNEKIDSLRAENQALRFSASQDRQNALLTTAMAQQTNTLIDRIVPTPIPSFNVCAPFHFGGWGNSWGGNWGNGWNRDGCGCGCGCGCG